MAFWLDRFRREDEEDIWEELKQMLKNSDKYEAEKKLQEARELEAFNKAWDKANGVNTESASPKNSKEKLTGMATPVLEGKVVYEKEPSIYEEIDARKDWSDELKAQKKAEVAKIQQAYEARNKEIDREYTLGQLKDYAGAALEIGSAFVPGYGGAKLAGTVAKKLAPKVGRKIAQEIATGTLKGASAGTVEGLGRGLLEDKNPLKTAVQDTITGATLGAGVGSAGANVQKVVKGKNLKQYGDIDLLDKSSRKQYSKDAREYYQDYNQGIIINKDGPIEFTNRGQREVLRWNPKQAQNFSELTKDIKKSKKLPNMPNKDDEKIYTDHFEVYRGNLGDHLIDVNKNGNRRYYTTKDIPEGSLRAPSTGTFENANNIISSTQNNLNPSQQSIQKPLSHNEWLEELKRRRKKGWW